MEDRRLVSGRGMEKFGADDFFRTQGADLAHPILHEYRHGVRATGGDNDHIRIDGMGGGTLPQPGMAEARIFAKITLNENFVVAVFGQFFLQRHGAFK